MKTPRRTGKPVVAVTMGDPAGVGPEICLRLLGDPAVQETARCVVLGDVEILGRCAEAIGMGFSATVWEEEALGGLRSAAGAFNGPGVVHFRGLNYENFEPGIVNAETGRAAYRFIERSIGAALAGEVDAVVTGPIHKEALQAAGISFPGHTEIFAAQTGAPRVCMFQYSAEVRASFVTTHVGYGEVPSLLSVERILDVVELTAEAMKRIRGRRPKIVVLGLNPHAGEHGLFGMREEERVIEPAVRIARERGHDVEGPIPPDTAFIPAKRKSTDAFVCMYHDQGHIPLKALAFDSAVNVSLGLPIIRTSVDHGTACDIAWKGVANAGSLREAVRLAALLAVEDSAG
jgi:4-hydroxythreonine-4-phosphate dehydrogenase